MTISTQNTHFWEFWREINFFTFFTQNKHLGNFNPNSTFLANFDSKSAFLTAFYHKLTFSTHLVQNQFENIGPNHVWQFWLKIKTIVNFDSELPFWKIVIQNQHFRQYLPRIDIFDKFYSIFLLVGRHTITTTVLIVCKKLTNLNMKV